MYIHLIFQYFLLTFLTFCIILPIYLYCLSSYEYVNVYYLILPILMISVMLILCVCTFSLVIVMGFLWEWMHGYWIRMCLAVLGVLVCCLVMQCSLLVRGELCLRLGELVVGFYFGRVLAFFIRYFYKVDYDTTINAWI